MTGHDLDTTVPVLSFSLSYAHCSLLATNQVKKILTFMQVKDAV